MIPLESLLEKVIQIANDASLAVLEIYQSSSAYSIHKKSDQSPITCADLLANKIICKQLKELTPDIPIISEEEAYPNIEVRSKWDYFWLIDPIDGTKGFIQKNGQFTVNIALIKDNSPILGVIIIPTSNTCFFASKNNGAYKIKHGHQTRIFCNNKTDPSVWNISLSSENPSRKMKNLFAPLGDFKIIPSHSSLKFCLIAEGSSHIYPRLHPTNEWDTAAAQCILEESGGSLMALPELQPLIYNKEQLLNPCFIAYAKAIEKHIPRLVKAFHQHFDNH